MERYTVPFLVRISDNRRKYIDSQKKSNYITRNTTILEQFIFNILPVISTSTILAPLNRIKVLLQVNKSCFKKDVTFKSLYNEIITQQGYLALWKGNTAYTFKILFQMFSRIVFYDRIKYYFNKKKKNANEKKFKIPGSSFALSIFSAFVAYSSTLILSYPYDLAFSRLTSDLTNNEKIDSTSVTKAMSLQLDNEKTNQLESRLGFIKYYKGFSLSLISVLPNSIITLVGYEVFSMLNLNKSQENTYFSNFFRNFGTSTIVSLFAGFFVYPIDTVKRVVQVSGTSRYQNDFFSISHVVHKIHSQGITNFYNGFSVYFMRNIPFSFIQYNIFLMFSSSLRKNSDVKVSNKSDEKESSNRDLNAQIKDN